MISIPPALADDDSTNPLPIPAIIPPINTDVINSSTSNYSGAGIIDKNNVNNNTQYNVLTKNVLLIFL